MIEDLQHPVLFDVGALLPEVVKEPYFEPPKIEIPDETEIMEFTPPLAGAVFSEDKRYRYTLWRRFELKGPQILFIGLNPSTATAEVSDPTVTRLISFAKREGCALMMLGNVSAFRATDPRKMQAHLRSMTEEETWAERRRNMDEIGQMAMCADKIVLCCGAGGKFHKMLDCVLLQLFSKAMNVPQLCFGVNKDGTPKHPLYLAGDTPLVPFNEVSIEEEF